MDELGSALVDAARATDDEVEAALASPFLYSRIQAAIAARERASHEARRGWLGLLGPAKLAVPAMALLTIVAAGIQSLEPARMLERESAMREPGSVSVLETDLAIGSFAASACALSNTQECAISSNEVLATIFAEENQEQQR
jgi:hypothetical protein